VWIAAVAATSVTQGLYGSAIDGLNPNVVTYLKSNVECFADRLAIGDSHQRQLKPGEQ
jgi:hypothetical protein